MLNFSDVALRRGPRVLFSGATFNLYRGEKIGITGENGSGKSSLMALVRGELQTDAGIFEMPTQLALAHVAQELQATERIAIEFVLDGDPAIRALEHDMARAEAAHDGVRLGELHARYAAAGGYEARSRAGRLLHGLGFAAADHLRPVCRFSGGWRVRLNLAQALMCRSDLLLLDEPTNHLDLDAILWLEDWLREYPGTLLLIAHDREFLDRIVNRIVNIEHGRAQAYRGNYSDFEERRAAEMTQQAALFTRQQHQIAHMEAFVQRFRAQATKARQAQSRLKALERMQRIAPAHVDSPFTFSFLPPEKLSRPLLTVEGQAAGYAQRAIVEQISFTFSPGDRVALLGRNGAGKSTCLKLLAGELPPLCGKRTEARDLRIGYFAQHQLEQLNPGESALQHLLRAAGGGLPPSDGAPTEQELRDFLASFGFRGDRVFEPVAPFSGGEKARLVLALLTYCRPNLLLLDEPTNHLDLEMRQALVFALQEYEGAVALISHDRHLLRTVADAFYLVHGGRASPFDGDLDDYAKWLAGAGSAAPQPAQETGAAQQRKQQKRADAERRERLRPLRSQLSALERELDTLTQQRSGNEAQLADPDTYVAANGSAVRDLMIEQDRLAARIGEIEVAWLELTERLEKVV